MFELNRRRRAMFRSLLLPLLLIAVPAVGQVSVVPPQPTRGEELTIYLMTMGPGSAVWERFGHNALWIRDDVLDTDIAYDYGRFSFEQENFLLRFIRGEMDYWMGAADGTLMANAYVQADRSVWVQELNLTPAQRADLRDFLEWNALSENRFYRYDYYDDNCSTRIRDVIDQVLGGQLREQMEAQPTGTTYRDHTRALTGEDVTLYTGLMAGLGQPVDRQLSAWEETFLPMRLRERIRDVTILTATGERQPLVVWEEAINQAEITEEPPIPESKTGLYLLVGVVIALGVAFVGRQSANGGRGGAAFAWIAGSWAVVAGLLGLILFGLWAFTDHETSYRNENLLQFSPLLLILVATVPRALQRGSHQSLWRAVVVAAAIAAFSLIGLAAKLLPVFSQANSEMIGLALPINIAVALSLYWIWRSRDDRLPAATTRAAERRVRAAA